MTIFEKLQKKLAEHTAMYGDLPDFILLTDKEYAELVGISDKNYQPKANDRNFWGVPTCVSDAIEEFTFAYIKNNDAELSNQNDDNDGNDDEYDFIENFILQNDCEKIKRVAHCRYPMMVNIFNHKIVRKNFAKNQWECLLQTEKSYNWFKSDWGDDEYLNNSEYTPIRL